MTNVKWQRDDLSWPRLDPVRTGIRGRCPRCGKGSLFDGFLTLRKGCDICGLSFSYADPADGPAFFVICFACIPAVIFAIFVQLSFNPPFWVHVLITLPVVSAACVLPLRPLKGWLICSQYFFQAREGQLAAPWYPYGPSGPVIVPDKKTYDGDDS